MSSSNPIIYWVLILSVIGVSCTEKFHLEIDSSPSILVVDGKITNESGPYEVKLFRTVDLIKADTLHPEVGAIISLNDDLGNIELFEEVRPGIYQTTNTQIKGTIGQEYWITIETFSGEKFESSPEKMPSPFKIENIYGVEEEKIISTSDKQKVVSFYFDASADNQSAAYLRWEYRESYEWISPEHLNSEVFTQNPSKVCYPTTKFPLINIYNAENLSSKTISKQSTATVYPNQVKLLYEYLIDITLFSTSQQNYIFWENIKAINFSEGALYDALGANINGNLIACEDNCQVLGYFEVASVTQAQNIFSASDFTIKFQTYPEECKTIEMRMEDDRPDETKYYILSSRAADRAVIYTVRRKECYECNIAYSTDKPSFWLK